LPAFAACKNVRAMATEANIAATAARAAAKTRQAAAWYGINVCAEVDFLTDTAVCTRIATWVREEICL